LKVVVENNHCRDLILKRKAKIFYNFILRKMIIKKLLETNQELRL
jgi:hypothetical protein